MRGVDDGALAWAAIDFLSALLLVVYVLIAPPPEPAKSSIEQQGVYLVEARWADGVDYDVDLYVEAPDGQITFYANAEPSSLVHLERDDLGGVNDAGVATNGERMVVRGTFPGEYVVNVHGYRGVGPIGVTVRLYRLRGADRLLRESRVALTREGDERTAFRFRVNDLGAVAGFSALEKRMVRRSEAQGTGA